MNCVRYFSKMRGPDLARVSNDVGHEKNPDVELHTLCQPTLGQESRLESPG